MRSLSVLILSFLTEKISAKCVLVAYCVQLFATLWTIVHHAPLAMEFSREEYWSGFPFPSPGVLPNPGVELRSPTWQADSLPAEPSGKPIKCTAVVYFQSNLKQQVHLISFFI